MLIAALFLNFGTVRSFLGTLNTILSPLYIGFAIAYIANPIMKLSEKYIFRFKVETEKRFNLKRTLSITFSLLIVALILTVMVLLIIPQIVLSLTDLTVKLGGYIEATINWLDDFLPDSIFTRNDLNLENFLNALNAFLGSELGNDITGISNKFGSDSSATQSIIASSVAVIKDYLPIVINYVVGFANGLLNTILGIFFAIYMLASKEKLLAQLKKTIRALSSEKYYHAIIELGHFSNKTFGGYLLGKVLDSLVVGIVMFIACSIFKVPYAILLSTLVAITNVIPVIGPFIGAIPGVLIIFIVDPTKVLVFIIINVIIQQIDGNIIVPKLLGETTGLDSLWVLFSITVMGGLWGIFGMFICVPIFAILYMIIKLLIEKKLHSKNLPMDTADYYTDKEIRQFTDHEDNKYSFATRVRHSGETIHQNALGTKIKKSITKLKKTSDPSKKSSAKPIEPNADDVSENTSADTENTDE